MEELLKNDIIELTVEGQGINGEGVARAGGKTIFIRGALKGEKVRARIILVKPRFDVAITTEILSAGFRQMRRLRSAAYAIRRAA